jgi:hypothetical protein
MRKQNAESAKTSPGWTSLESGNDESRSVFGAFWALLFLGALLVAGPWAGYHGLLLGGAGILMLLRPPAASLPRLWWILAGFCLVAGLAAFLPAGWFAMPEWRSQLAALGVETGSLVAIQFRQAAEAFALFAITLFTGMWLAGHRPSPLQARRWALMFTVGVAAYAIIARIMQEVPPAGHPGMNEVQLLRFGFFLNRNHTATYLAMGTICGLGNVLQALRDKRFPAMAVALIATGVCLWAVAAWSMSRAGVLLVAIGCLLWLPILGRRYLGTYGFRAIGLICLAATGIFFIADSGVKTRLSDTVEKVKVATEMADEATPLTGKPTTKPGDELDFRLPTHLDTLGLIRDFKWTGIGAGQFHYVFPQYRKRTAVANELEHLHPESDWLWLAAETGIPATLALAALVILAAWRSRAAIAGGRDRALRSACLVAALVVPIHGMGDVPGHHLALAWSAVFLFSLSLRPADDHASASSPGPSPWPFRLAACVLLLASAFLVRAQWWGGPQPAATAGKRAIAEVVNIYQEDLAVQREAVLAKAGPYQPAPADDPLERALGLLQQAQAVAPLERNLYRLQGSVALAFDDKNALVQRAFAIERALDPTWVEAPLLQAQAWSGINPEQAALLWTTALDQARQLDQSHPANPSTEAKVRDRIRRQLGGNPALERLWHERFQAAAHPQGANPPRPAPS